ncbi:MAG: DPP IV N-terminal domain-containing protein, partial [Thermodesulfovibrionales bacterium]
SNYIDDKGNIIIAHNLPVAWKGYRPDCYFNFDEEGFDRNIKGGSYTGWRSFRYYPFAANQWPTNGSTTDAIIRLPEVFRQDERGRYNHDVYKVNLAIVEAVVKQRTISTEPLNERAVNMDLDGNGKIDVATKVKFDWKPLEGRFMYYAGMAGVLQKKGELRLAGGLYPLGTEFLHSVRYIDWDDKNNTIRMSARFKELRYGKKIWWADYNYLHTFAQRRGVEQFLLGERAPEGFVGDYENGIENLTGWVYQGFIEDKKGNLRPQTNEETLFCIGCHRAVGITTDSSYSFARKFEGGDKTHKNYGWGHWSQRDLRGIREPKATYEGSGSFYEYSYYLMYNSAGDDLRENGEIKQLFFNPNGTIKKDMVERLRDDISLLLYPSRQRAMDLNKAYKVIVDEQSFIKGRDTTVMPSKNVHQETKVDELTKVKRAVNTLNVNTSTCDTANVTPQVTTQFKDSVIGIGIGGPDGKFYNTNKDGLIFKNTYYDDSYDIFYSFPHRITLPLRSFVSVGSAETCSRCHRIPSPVATSPLYSISLPATGLDEDEKRILTNLTNSEGNNINARWSPDGKTIAWVSDRTGDYHIWLMNADGSNKRRLTNGNTINGWQEWHPKGGSLVFWSYNKDTKKQSIKTINADGSGLKTLVESSSSVERPRWSPEGRFVAYSSNESGNWEIWMVSSDGSTKTKLTSGPGSKHSPIFNNDGSMIIYKKLAPSATYGLAVEGFIRFKGSYDSYEDLEWDGAHSIVSNDWSKDGRWLAYNASIVDDACGQEKVSRKTVIGELVFGVDGKVRDKPIIISGCQSLGDVSAVFSPDGKFVAHWSWDKTYRATIWIYDIEKRLLTQLTRSGHDMYPQWSPDGKRIAFESSRTGRMDIWVATVK